MTEQLLSSYGPVTLITTFRLREAASAERFVELWEQVGKLMATRPGFRRSQLFRSLVGGGEGETFIHVADWSNSALLSHARSDPEVRATEREVDALLADRSRILCTTASGELLPRP